jgi:hypothetical protein
VKFLRPWFFEELGSSRNWTQLPGRNSFAFPQNDILLINVVQWKELGHWFLMYLG